MNHQHDLFWALLSLLLIGLIWWYVFLIPIQQH